MAWAAVPLDRALFESFDFDPIKALAVLYASDLKAKQTIDVDKTQCLAGVDGEWPDRVAERTYRPDSCVSTSISYRKQFRFETGQICLLAIETINRIVRSRMRLDPRDDASSRSVNDGPIVSLE